MLSKVRDKKYEKKESDCLYQLDCHFYTIKEMTPNSEQLKKLYCYNMPKGCRIYKTKSSGKPVPITLWPTGQLELA